MSWLDIWFLALALSVDAFVVAFSYGLVIKKKKGRFRLRPQWRRIYLTPLRLRPEGIRLRMFHS